MFNQFNINKDINIKAELLKNRRDPIRDITKYINKISYKLNSISTIDIKINKYIMNKHIKKENSVYNEIKNNMQLILTINGKKERYILLETTKTLSKNKGERTFTGYSFEKTLENKLISFSSLGKSYPLVCSDSEQGVLDIVCKNSGWKIGFVDELAKNEFIKAPVIKKTPIKKNLTLSNIQPDTLLWDVSILIKPNIDSLPLKLSIEHQGVNRYDSYGDILTEKENIITVLDPIHKGVKNIKAYYYSVAGNRYGIKFLLTLVDGIVITQIKEFTNLKDLKMICDKVNVSYETGELADQYVTKYVWLENIDTNIYSFLNDMQEEFNVLFVFDGFTNTIDCYSKDNLNNESPLLLSFDSNIISMNIKQPENPITAIKVTGNDGVSIVDINKYGSNIIYNYSYFKNNGLISEELSESLHQYEIYLEEKQSLWNELSNRRRLLYENKVKLDCEIKSLSERIITLSELLAAFISTNGSIDEQNRIKKEKTELEKLFNSNVSLRTQVDNKISSVDTEMCKINSSIQRNNCNIFTDEDIEELSDIDIIESYTNDIAITTDGLFNSAVWYLNERVKPTVELNVQCNNLIKIINNPNGWDSVLKLGNLFYLNRDLVSEIGEDQVRLSGIDIDVSNKTIDNLSFTNKVFPIDLLKMAKKMQKKAVATIINNNSYKSTIKDAKAVNAIVNNIANNGININSLPIKTNETYSISEPTNDENTSQTIRGSLFEGNDKNISICDNDIEQSSAGMFVKSRSNPNNQLYIGAGIFAISSNGFETSDIAIDNNGITAKLLKGKILLGEKLYITSDDGNETFYIGNMESKDGFGLRISDTDTGLERVFLGTELDENGKREAKLRLNSKDGSTAISELGFVSVYSYVYNDDLDSLNPLEFNHMIDAGTLEVRECKLSIFLQKYRATVKSLTSGGQITTTTSNGTQISTTSDCGEITFQTENSGFYSEFIDSFEDVSEEIKKATSDVILYEETEENVGKLHYHEYENIKHKHKSIITIPEHHHTAKLIKHNHTYNIDSHYHTVDTRHNHDLQAGIFESTLPTNCSIYVNDILVMTNINYDTVVDIGGYLKVGETNKIKITSDTLGRIQLSIFYKSFIEY